MLFRSTGPEDGLVRVELPYPTPASPASRAEHDRIFGCELVFGTERITYVRDTAVVRRPLAQGDAELRRQMEARAEKLAAARASEHALVRDVHGLIARRLADGVLDLESAAKHLEMSPRVLARRLAEHGTTFSKILDDARREMALSYLQDRSFSLLDIAYLLGFSEQSAFQRAFKRWTGKAPGEYRRRA